MTPMDRRDDLRMAHDAERVIDRGDLASCPLTRFFQEQEVRENHVLHWHAQWHLSAFERERATAAKLLMQWMAEQTIKRQSASKH